jgi:transcriptional/translational regulatory protein YebC/TACO1
MGAQWKAKHKDVAANAKGRLFGKLAKDIMIAARHGADPAANARLRLVLEQARKVSMPKDTLDRAIKKGAGLGSDAVHFEHAMYEGQLGTSGSVSWDFDHVGMIEAEPTTPGADPDMAAIEAGAQDLEPADEDGTTLFLTDPTELDLVSRALPAQGFTVLSAKLGYRPKNPVSAASLSAEQLEEVESFLAALDANEDVQNIFAGLHA